MNSVACCPQPTLCCRGIRRWARQQSTTALQQSAIGTVSNHDSDSALFLDFMRALLKRTGSISSENSSTIGPSVSVVKTSSAKHSDLTKLTTHEKRMIRCAIVLSMLSLVPFFGGPLIGTSLHEGARFSSGAAGVAMVLFLASEGRRWRDALTPGHKLVFWWFWIIVVPFRGLSTRARRPTSATCLVLAPSLIFLLGSLVFLIRDLFVFLH